MYEFDINKNDWCWQLVDGTFWSTEQANFVDQTFANAWLERSGFESVPSSPVDENGQSTQEGLISALKFYNLPLGVLASPEEKIAQFNNEINKRLQTFAQEHDWDTIEIALVQTGIFEGDAKIAQSVYDAVWTAAIPLTSQIEAGTLSVEDALTLLPPMSWVITPTEFSERSEIVDKYYRPWTSDSNGDPEAGILVMLQSSLDVADQNDAALVSGIQDQYRTAYLAMKSELDAIKQKYHPTTGGA